MYDVYMLAGGRNELAATWSASTLRLSRPHYGLEPPGESLLLILAPRKVQIGCNERDQSEIYGLTEYITLLRL